MLKQILSTDSPWTASISLQGTGGGGQTQQIQQHTKLRSHVDLCRNVPSCQDSYESAVPSISNRFTKESCAYVIIQAQIGVAELVPKISKINFKIFFFTKVAANGLDVLLQPLFKYFNACTLSAVEEFQQPE